MSGYSLDRTGNFFLIFLLPQKYLFVALRPNSGHGLLILDVSRLHTTTKPQWVGLLWTSDQLVADTRSVNKVMRLPAYRTIWQYCGLDLHMKVR